MRTIVAASGLAAILVSHSWDALAETVYVIDHLAVGVHEEKTPNSPIIEVLPTGTALEVLAREDSLVRVRTEDGLEGWVDQTYVMEDKPAQLALLELEARHADTLNELEVARAEIESLTITVESLESAGQGQASTGAATTDALREMQRLAEENQALKEEIASAKALSATAQSIQEVIMAPEAAAHAPRSGALLGLGKWHWILVAALMVLAFGFGGYLVDWGIRRRHGGFRV